MIFLGFSQRANISPAAATRADLAHSVGDLCGRPRLASQINKLCCCLLTKTCCDGLEPALHNPGISIPQGRNEVRF